MAWTALPVLPLAVKNNKHINHMLPAFPAIET
jgi:hypothetical protein